MSRCQRTKAQRRALAMRFKKIQGQDPGLSIKYIAERLGVSVSYIYNVRRELEGGRDDK